MAGLDLDIAPGERVLLLGASGSGKSTLLRGIAGVLGGDEDGEQSGSLLIDAQPASVARGRSGLVLQDPDSQIVLARVGDDIAFGCENLAVPADQIWPRVDQALTAVGLDVDKDRSTAALSGGQKQRLALAGALAMQPGILLLDEPTANLDPAGVVEVRDSVVRAAEESGATLIVVEHRVDVWAEHVDRVIVLASADDGGGLLADGPPADVFRAHRDALSDADVWVPGVKPELVRRARDNQDEAVTTSSPEALLRADRLSVGRRPFGEKHAVSAAEDVAVEVTGGRVLAIVGANGSGKSTLALTLAGLLAPVSGAVEATDALAMGLGHDPIRWRSSQLLTRLGMVFQSPDHQLLARTVREELEVGPRAVGLTPEQISERVEPLLDGLRLRRLAKVNPFTLSGGEKRRLTVAAALATRPRVLILDEPTFGQDARTWRELTTLMLDVRDAGTALIVITHDEELVRALTSDDGGTIFRMGERR